MLRKRLLQTALIIALLVGFASSAMAGIYGQYVYAPAPIYRHFFMSLEAGAMWQHVSDDSFQHQFLIIDDAGLPLYQVNQKTSLDLNNNIGLAGRISLGYDFNPNFGIEIGGMYYSTTKINADAHVHVIDLLEPNNVQNINFSKKVATVRNYGADMLFIGMIPVSRTVYIIGKLGAAYIHTDVSTSNQHTNVVIFNQMPVTLSFKKVHESSNSIRPEAAVGIGVELSDASDMTIAYNQIFGNGHLIGGFTPYIGTAYVGLRYYFA